MNIDAIWIHTTWHRGGRRKAAVSGTAKAATTASEICICVPGSISSRAELILMLMARCDYAVECITDSAAKTETSVFTALLDSIPAITGVAKNLRTQLP
ncbi:MAG: hypothetical protein AAF235_03775 [Planctomycetota bacterium]